MEEVRSKLRGAVAILAIPTSLCGQKRLVKTTYCIPDAAGAWHLQSFHPLINPRAENTFAEIWMLDQHVERLRLRRFHSDRETRFVYRFNSDGGILFVEGSVDLWNRWVAQTTLPAKDRDGHLPQDIRYYKQRSELGDRRDEIGVPSGADRYLRDLIAAPVYASANEIPCADQIRAVERTNAAQK